MHAQHDAFEIDWQQEDEVSHLVSDNQEDDEMKKEKTSKATMNSWLTIYNTVGLFVRVPTLGEAISMDTSLPHLHLAHKLECEK